MRSAAAAVKAAYAKLRSIDHPELWISVLTEQAALNRAHLVDDCVAAGQFLPLAGCLVAVKDNIDVFGFETTAGHPSYAYTPARSATAVARLEEVGAIVIGKTNLDQFATGLVGTRSPYGVVPHFRDAEKVSGGSSSGSAVAVALSVVDIGIGTDTAGSGRVPASFNGLIGIKPTLGLIPNTGVVPASRSFDTVSIFTRDIDVAVQAFAIAVGSDGSDPRSRSWPADVRLGMMPDQSVAIPDKSGLNLLSPNARRAFSDVVDRLNCVGIATVEVDIEPLMSVASLLYDGAIVAERFQSVGKFLIDHAEGADPTVREIIIQAERHAAWQFVDDLKKIDDARLATGKLFSTHAALLLPTAPRHPTLAEVLEEPMSVNRELGAYTNFVNLLDLAAIAVPAGEADGSYFGVSILTSAFHDQVGIDLAARYLGSESILAVDTGFDLCVFGAHLREQQLNIELTELGGRYIREVRTSAAYRLFDLLTVPRKPGLIEVSEGGGVSIEGELWRLSSAALGTFLAALPWPMSLGKIHLDDGSDVLGFMTSSVATQGALDISEWGGWRSYLVHGRGSP